MSWENPAVGRETASVSHLHASADQIGQAQVGYNAGQWWSAASDAVSAIHLARCALRAAGVAAPDMPALAPPAALTTSADAAAWIAAATQYHASASSTVTAAGLGQVLPRGHVRHFIPSSGWSIGLRVAAKALEGVLAAAVDCGDAALGKYTKAFQTLFNLESREAIAVDCAYDAATASALTAVLGHDAPAPLWGPGGRCNGLTPNCNKATISPNAVRLAAGVPNMSSTKQAWQVWEGERVAALKHLGVGQTVAAEVRGVGAVHFHRHPSGATLVYGPRGMGALAAQDGGNQTTDPALLAAVQAMLGGDPCSLYMNPAGNPAVRMFQVAWNGTSDSSMGSPKLTVDGKYGPNTASAAAQANGSNVPAACKEAPPPGPQPQPQPQPTPTPPAPSTPTNYLPWVIGAVGVVAVLGVGYAVMSKPSSKDMKAHAKHHDRMATHHRLHARHARHVARSAAAEESALETHRRRRAREETRRHRARAA